GTRPAAWGTHSTSSSTWASTASTPPLAHAFHSRRTWATGSSESMATTVQIRAAAMAVLWRDGGGAPELDLAAAPAAVLLVGAPLAEHLGDRKDDQPGHDRGEEHEEDEGEGERVAEGAGQHARQHRRLLTTAARG